MDNDARTGNSSLAVRRMHDDSQQPLTTDCRTTRRSALAAGTLLLLLCVPALGVAAQATQTRVLTAQPPPERAVAGNNIVDPAIHPEMLQPEFINEPRHPLSARSYVLLKDRKGVVSGTRVLVRVNMGSNSSM